MRVAIIGPAHPLRGGLATYDERLALELINQGHEAVNYSFSLQYPSFLFPGTTQYTDEPAPEKLTIHSIINSVNPFNWISVGNRLKKERYDLIIVRYWLPFMGPCLGTILRRVRKNNHTRILCIADNINPHEKRPGDKQFTNYFIKPVQSFITMSEQVLKDLNEIARDKPKQFHPHPTYDNFGHPVAKEEACKKINLNADKKYILFFGFIRKYKGLDILLEAMNDERIKTARIELIVAGEYYSDKELYTDIIDKHQLSNVHMLTEFIPNSDVRYYFSAADLVVQPYRTATQSGITQIAYHFEKPMVVTNVGGLPEIVPDGKVGFVTAIDPTAIADAILKFYTEGIPNMEQNLIEEKKKYSWEMFVKKLLDTAF
ncbi:MAG: glycosyltransferase [Flavipsychrobacter sp.]